MHLQVCMPLNEPLNLAEFIVSHLVRRPIQMGCGVALQVVRGIGREIYTAVPPVVISMQLGCVTSHDALHQITQTYDLDTHVHDEARPGWCRTAYSIRWVAYDVDQSSTDYSSRKPLCWQTNGACFFGTVATAVLAAAYVVSS